MKTFWITITVISCFLLLVDGCGKHSHKTAAVLPSSSQPQATAPRSLQDILAEIDTYKPPEGVDANVFERMRAQLREGIQKRWNSK
jgi:hypothetical protein